MIRLGLDADGALKNLDGMRDGFRVLTSDIENAGHRIGGFSKLSSGQLSGMGKEMKALEQMLAKSSDLFARLEDEWEERVARARERRGQLEEEAREAAKAGDLGKSASNMRQIKSIDFELEKYRKIGGVLDSIRQKLRDNLEAFDNLQSGQNFEKLRTRLTSLKNDMASMIASAREQGGETEVAAVKSSEAYRKMEEEVRNLGTALREANAAARQANGTIATVQGIAGGLQGVAGAFGVAKGALAAFGQGSKDLDKLMAQVQGLMSMMMGLQTVMRTLSKESAFMQAYSKYNAMLLGTATAGARASLSVRGLGTAFKTLWTTLKANPLGMILAGVAALSGAVMSLVNSIKSQAERQIALNKVEENYLTLLQQISEFKTSKIDDAVTAKERELSIAKSRNKSLAEQYKLEDELYRLKSRRASYNLGLYSGEVREMEENRKRLVEYQKQLSGALDAKALERGEVMVDLKLSGKPKEQDVDKAIEALQGLVDNYKKKVEIGMRVKAEAEEMKVEAARMEAERREAARSAAAVERAAVRETQSVRISLMKDSYEKETASVKAAATNRIADLKLRLSQEKNLTVRARKAINDEIKLQQEKLNEDLLHLEREHQKKLLALRRQIEDESVTSAPRTAEEQLEDLLREYTRKHDDVVAEIKEGLSDGTLSKEEVEAKFDLLAAYDRRYHAERLLLENQLKERSLGITRETLELRLAAVREGTAEELRLRLEEMEAERQAELAANKNKAPDERQDEKDIHAKYDRQRLALMMEDYVSYQQKMTDLTETWELRRADLERRIAAEQDPKRRKALEQALANMEKTYKQAFKELQNDFIKNNIGEVFVEATYANVKEALAKLTEMEGYRTAEEFNARYGMSVTGEQFEELIGNIRKVKREVQNLGKEGYTLRDAFKDLFGGKSRAEAEQGLGFLVSGMQTVASLASSLAGSMREFGEAAEDTDLTALADTIEGIANTINGAASYASTGFELGGVAGAVAGGLLGTVQGVMSTAMRSEAERIKEEKQRQQEARDYLSDILSSITSLIGTMESLNSAITSLDYGNYSKSLLEAMNEMNTGGLDENNWQSLLAALEHDASGGYSHQGLQNVILSGGITDLEARALLENAMESARWDSGVRERVQAILDHWDERTQEDIDYLFQVIAGSIGAIGRENIAQAYAAHVNWLDLSLDSRRLELLREMKELYEQGSMSAMEYFNIQMKLDKYNLDALEVQRIKAYAEGNMELVRQIENQMAELRYSMGERAREMFEGLAGIDLQSIVNKWLDIFKEFGTNFSGAIDKINESIDDMIRNMVIQTAFVQPLLARLKAYMNTYAATSGLATDADGNYVWTDEAFRGMAEGLRGFIEGARQDFVGLADTLNTLGLGFDSASSRSASQKGVATASQESVDRLDGRATAIQGHTFSISENTRIIKDNVAAIMGSVQRIETYTQHLIRMDNDLHSLRNAVQTVETRGVSIRV